MTQRPRTTKPKSRTRAIKRKTTTQPVRHRRRPKGSAFTARLTVDVTPDLRARIKITAFESGVTVAYMLRLLLLKTFPRTKGARR